ncbi:MAG: enoyl-CoA hydratase [Desulfococcaceae bacterium]
MEDAIQLNKEAGIAWLTLNRPGNRNALSLAVMETILERLEAVRADADTRVLIIRGNGPAFCAGHDLREIEEAEGDMRHLRKVFGTCARMMQTLQTLPQPVVAQVQGIATAAGCQLAAACDLAVAETGARFSTPGVRIGLFCITPMVPLVRVIGRRRALEMLLTGRFVDAEEALRFGLVNRVAPPERLEEETRELAAQLANFSGFTLGFGKRAFYEQVDMAEGEAYAAARDAIVLNCMAEDAREGIGAFLEKRPPEWKHR